MFLHFAFGDLLPPREQTVSVAAKFDLIRSGLVGGRDKLSWCKEIRETIRWLRSSIRTKAEFGQVLMEMIPSG
jgi:hypothetical protein